MTEKLVRDNCCSSLFNNSEKRKERREHAENCRLEQSLILGGSAVQTEYDSDFARLGRRFGIGDGKTSKDLALQFNE